MKIKLAKYIAKLLTENGITHCFSVTGGGAMHLNEAFGHEKKIKTFYMHHEQSAAMAAESYARIYNKPALLCVTTGPGGTNAITGVLGAWLDSIPMIVISGQVRFDNTARFSGVGIRSMGDQEYDITRAIDCMAKYSRMIVDPMSIRYEVEKCLYISQTGRPGPVWLDVPVDIQGCFIEENELIGFDPEEYLREQENELANLSMEEKSIRGRLSRENSSESSEINGNNRVKNLTVEGLASESKVNESSFGENRLYENSAMRSLEPTSRGKTKGHRNPGLDDPLMGISFKKQKIQTPPIHITKDDEIITRILERLKVSKRPIFYTGNGIRIAGAYDLFLKTADLLGIPVVVSWNAIDIIPEEHPLKAGQPGGRGDRPGNLAVQNSDFIISVGSRLNIRQVGYNYATWARAAFTVVCDIDIEELKKPSVHIDIPVHADAREFLEALSGRLVDMGIKAHGDKYNDSKALRDIGYGDGLSFFKGGKGHDGRNWIEECQRWMKIYSPYQEKFTRHGDDEPANIYAFLRALSDFAHPGQITVVGNGSPCVAGAQVYKIKDGSRFISQDAVAAMGYGLPAAIGACVATHDVSPYVYPLNERNPRDMAKNDKDGENFILKELESAGKSPYWPGSKEIYAHYYDHDIICITGDGSIMMNLQELETVISHFMPIKIFLINNGGYHSIRQTQTNLFKGERLVGIGVDSGDLSFPDFGKIASAFGIPYNRIEHNFEIDMMIKKALSIPGPVITEVIVSIDQPFEPSNSAKKLPDGSITSPPLEDMSPFLTDEEMDENMFIPRVKE